MKELLNQIKRLRVLVVGDVMLDRYVSGEVHRISPEAPVPVLTVGSEKVVAGGAANVALNASSLGADVEVCGWFGTDIQGTQLRGQSPLLAGLKFMQKNNESVTAGLKAMQNEISDSAILFMNIY